MDDTAASLDAVEHLALHAVLDLPSSHHQMDHFVDRPLGIFLLKKKEQNINKEAARRKEWEQYISTPLSFSAFHLTTCLIVCIHDFSICAFYLIVI